MFYKLWLKRVLFSTRNLFQFSSLFSLFGLIVGVASLTTALLVVEGFSTGLKRAIWDISGHVIVLSETPFSKKNFQEKIKLHKNTVKNQIDFLSFEGLILKSGNFKGALFEGVDIEGLKKNTRLNSRLVKGSLFGKKDFLIVGSALANELNLQPGSLVSVVVPKSGPRFSRKQKMFTVSAIVDFGRHTLNSRYVLMPLSSAQTLKQQAGSISGSRFWLEDSSQSKDITLNLRMNNPLLIVSSWRDIERGFFEVIEMDKRIIFFVLLILVLAAGFNVSGSLFVTVFRRTREISILKAMGAGKRLIAGLFLMEGLILGMVGSFLGVFLGWGVCKGLLWLQSQWNFIPLDVYQTNEIILSMRGTDIPIVFIVTLTVSFLASLLPTIRAYNRNVTEGLLWN